MVFGLFSRKPEKTGFKNEQGDKSCEDDRQQQASDYLLVTVVAKRPRAIIVLFGSMGATVETMSKYAQLYHDNKCSTISATSSILSLAANDTVTIGEVAITAARETARLIRMAEMTEMGFGRVPVVVHVLGNGGAQVLEELEKRINEVVPRTELMHYLAAGSRASTPLRFPGFMQSGSSRSLMNSGSLMKSGSARSLMKSGSTRSLMKSGSTRSLIINPDRNPAISSPTLGRPTLEKTPSAPSAMAKGSARSLMTETSVSDEENENPAAVRDAYEKLQAKLIRPIEVRKTCPPESPRLTLIGLSSAPACIFSSSADLMVPDCSQMKPTQELQFLPQCIGGSPLDRRLQQRRRRKQSSPNVKRLDMERTAVFSAASPPRYNPDDRAYRLDMELFCYRLLRGSIVFDSGPYFPSVPNELAAVDTLLAGNAGMKLLAQSTIIGSHGWDGVANFNYLGQTSPKVKNDSLDAGRAGQFWKSMEDLKLSKRHAFIYSQADRICKRDEIKKFISTQEAKGIQTLEVELVSTDHLQHRMRRVDKYTEFIERVLDTLEGRRIDVPETVDDWFDSDDEAEESGHETVHHTISGRVEIEPATPISTNTVNQDD